MSTFQVDIGNATYEVDAPDETTAWKMANQVHANAPSVAPKQNINDAILQQLNSILASYQENIFFFWTGSSRDPSSDFEYPQTCHLFFLNRPKPSQFVK